ncbi:MAG: SRPBCC domain-containing protein [Euryarchaeota archaeon]|nr:SRPBCC domain-containing protein [Euryarchaeota archaeon]
MAYEFRLGIRIHAPRERVFEHLLLPHHLARWWCSFAQVEPKPGGRFNFGGDYCIVPPPEHMWRCVFTGGEVRRSVTFTWPLFDADTLATWTVEDDEGGSRFLVLHRNVPKNEGVCGRLLDAYRVCLGNLKAIVEGRADSLRPEYAPLTKPEVRLAILIDVPAERVFEALVTPTLLEPWATRGGRAAVDIAAKVYGWGNAEGPDGILETDLNKRLAVRWRHRGKDTTVAWSLEGKASGTGVYLLHNGLADGADTDRNALRGWWSGLLVDLKNYLETGETGFTEPYEEQQGEV